MATRFAALEARVSSRVDNMYGEPVRVQPRAVEDFGTESDPDRPAYEATGVADFNPKIVQMKGVGRHDGDYADIEGGAVHVSFHESKLPPDRNRWPKQGDLLVLVDRTTDRAFRVVTVEPDGIGRMVCRCARDRDAC
jgi:hypothetical protein